MRITGAVSLVIFFVVITRIAWVSYMKPSYNFDTLPYMAVLLNSESSDSVKIHQTIYHVAKAEIPIDQFTLMTDTSIVLRKNVLKSSNQFFQFTSFFRIKPLYTRLSYLAYKMGLPLSKAPIAPSVFSFVAISILLLWFFNSFLKEVWIAALLSLSIMVSPPILEAARLATPDALSTLFLLIASYLFLKSSFWGWTVFVLSLSILVRVDNIIFATIFISFQTFAPSKIGTPKMNKLVFLSSLALWIICALWIMKSANIQNGFESFYGGLSKKMDLMIVLKEAFIGLATLQTSDLSIILGVTAFILFYKTPFTFRSLNLYQYFFLMMATYFMVRYVMFPNLTTRFFLSVYISSVVLAVDAIAKLIKNKIDTNHIST
jgi:hypothetical protein